MKKHDAQKTGRTAGNAKTADTAGPEPVTVAIGCSAGGLSALTAFFDAVPADLGASFVIIAHLDPTRPSELAAILSRHTAMDVREIEGRMALQPDHVYIIAPNRQIRASDGEVEALAFEEPRGQRAPVDGFLRSMAGLQRDGIAVILSGGGSDGSMGARSIKAAGGLVLVQDPAEAEHGAMPSSVIATGCADVVLPVAQLAAKLAELVGTRRRLGQQGFGGNGNIAGFQRVLGLLGTQTGHDFSQYKAPTVLRRLTRRMEINRCSSIDQYLTFLESSPGEIQALLGSLLISVTTFFRDPDSFEALAARVIPEVMAKPPEAGPVRVWVAGCATGEEAYSIAILLLEASLGRSAPPDVQIFATDIDSTAIETAREGLYPLAIEADMPPERLHRYFTREGDLYRIKRIVRDLVVFANHSILKDPPFSRVDLVSCRNVLIYLKPAAQNRVLTTLHYALNAGGYLFLGSAESTDSLPQLFRAIEPKWRIYKAVGKGSDRPLPTHRPTAMAAMALPRDRAGSASANGQTEAALHRQALENLAPPSLLVDPQHRVLHISDSAGRYLRHPGGTPSSNIMQIVLPELQLDLRRSRHRAFESNEPSLSLPVAVNLDGEIRRVVLNVRPVCRDHTVSEALVVFNEGATLEPLGTAAGPATEDKVTDEIVTRLYEELEATHEQLRASRAEYETTNEELRAANEELQSINEEYRSTSEELETSKEELQSMNEELQTLNRELGEKVGRLAEANADMENLIAATEGGTLFLGAELRIKLFTPGVAEYFNITSHDIGRPITDFTHRLVYDGFAEDAREVLRHLGCVERKIATANGDRVLLRLRPYRTPDDRIEGIMVTFVDVTDLHRAEVALRERDQHFRALVNATSYAVYRMSPDWSVMHSLDGNGFVRDVSEPSNRWLEEYVEPEDREAVLQFVSDAIRRKAAFELEHRVRRSDGSLGWTHSKAVPIMDEGGEVREWFCAASDITEWRKAAEELALAGRIETVGKLAGAVSHDFNNLLTIILANIELAEMRISDEAVRTLLHRASMATELGAGFNRRLLSLAGKQTLSPERINLSSHVEKVLGLLDHAFGGSIDLEQDLQAADWHVFADPDEIDNAILNLALNARDAIEGSGTIVVGTRTATIGEAEAKALSAPAPGEYVRIYLADTGTGMSAEVAARADEAFFSTKKDEMGSGLGLFSVRSFIRRSGGFLLIDSKAMEGTTVSIYLPRAAGRGTPEVAEVTGDVIPPDNARDEKSEPERGDGQTILVVEDSESMRIATRERLETLGYAVLEAGSAREAMEILERRTDIALVFSDVVMPGEMNGLDLVRWVRQKRPGIDVLLTSGYHSEVERMTGRAMPQDIECLAKPYSLAQLASSVRMALRAGGAPPEDGR
ncbi:CheR family methyltransferase [Poseidonocella sp. HB161398]|uniref:CheR family methyltransferase n=1 Tax=Poseidonocella sp. HB161398 TaxID=2320855 RepID=UPI001107CF9E|nr:CheR family methyltransferase [Poseidonocella sp. HB161398]